MLITHLATPATAALPDRAIAAPPLDTNPPVGGHLPRQPSDHLPDGGVAFDPAVVVRPVEHSVFKSEYTFPEVLRSVSSAREPFRQLGESVGDAIEILRGHEMTTSVRQGLTVGGEVVDIATGLIPDVQLVRLPGELAGVLADGIDGKVPTGETISGLMQNGDPRAFGSHMAPHARRRLLRPMRNELPVEPAAPLNRGLHPVPRAQMAARRKPSPENEIEQSRDATAVVDAVDELDADHFFLAAEQADDALPAPSTPLHIEGEAEHLRGYETVFTAEQFPSGEHPRLLLIHGERYIGGEAGYYRAVRGRSDDHWLIDAPRRDKAQVPVTFDRTSGQWQAHAPLRLCGGGCSQSKGISTDSIDGRYSEIEAAVSHLQEEKMQLAILHGMEELAHMHLLRTNRPDTRGRSDNSIMVHRAALRKAMEHIDRYAPLAKQQRQAAAVTSMHYYWNHYAEAFCHENAEILFHQLLQNGVSEDRIRIISITPKRRSSHVLVLYTETHDLTTLLDHATPQPPVVNHHDGISGVTFSGFIYINRGTTILLDPWSTTKAIEFSGARDESDVMRTLDDAFADIGHQSGQPFTVSVTRPFGSRIFGARQRSIASLSASGSPARLGDAFGGEGSAPLHPEPLSNPESESRDSADSVSNGDADSPT
ncbi:hypothetical protein PHO31112_00229 [Pandoraea horticolens]|uniref:Uncharacterized protein n=1 Tax=Pandoraea horticolens TaxID=2508298 RepID=A0A5E4RK89_9BURK|nr:hypothetical protein [Pandoraea horticolens]VVD63353.1 hypothetical protein PHO31112_00229 [Pandoraea horticolens]